jgi:hypothetical protein
MIPVIGFFRLLDFSSFVSGIMVGIRDTLASVPLIVNLEVF